MIRPRLISSVAFSLIAVLFVGEVCHAQKTKVPHAVFVAGSREYSPQTTLPGLAKQLEKLGFKTTVLTTDYNPEKNIKGIPGLKALKTADVAIFYMRFLTLPDSQMKLIEDYVKSGKPVVGFRTSTHAFIYPKNSPHHHWNNGFGKQVLGTQYLIHITGKTSIAAAPSAADHPILTGVDLKQPREAAGTLYLSDIPKDAKA